MSSWDKKLRANRSVALIMGSEGGVKALSVALPVRLLQASDIVELASIALNYTVFCKNAEGNLRLSRVITCNFELLTDFDDTFRLS
jgi:hypothetical protein